MTEEDLGAWFAANKTLLETAYLADEQPWQQSGFGLHTPRTFEAWEVHRKLIADCVERAGAFLDVGCANGFLLECGVRWTAMPCSAVEPYGLDLSEKPVAVAQARLPAGADHLCVGNGWDWLPPRTFDYVATALEYVPDALQVAYVSRLLREFVGPDGRLIVVGNRGRGEASEDLCDAGCRFHHRVRCTAFPSQREAPATLVTYWIALVSQLPPDALDIDSSPIYTVDMVKRTMQETTFLILTALAAGSQHGYGIITDVARISDGRVRLRAGTLYSALDRLRLDGLISIEREQIVENRLRRYYQLTPEGSRQLAAEAARLRSNAAIACARLGLTGG